jgi:pilus assembly protein Flp/PilA
MLIAPVVRVQLAWIRLRARAQERAQEQLGATAVEYALMLALIAVVIVGAVTLLGTETSELYADPALNGALSGS